MTAPSPLSPRLALMLAVPPLLWAGNAVVGRLTVPLVPPLTLNALRWALAFLVLLSVGWRALATAEHRAEVWRRWPYLALLGLLGTGAYNALQYLALTSSTPINVTLIAASLPIASLLLGRVCFGARMRRAQALGAALSLAGVGTVLGRGQWHTLTQVRFVAGDLYMLAAVVCWALYSWLLAKPPAGLLGGSDGCGPRGMISTPGHTPRPWNWAEFLLVQVLFGLGWASLASMVELASTPMTIQWTPAVWSALAYVAIGPSVLAYWFWGVAVAEAGPVIAGFYTNLTPLFAAVMSAGVLGDTPQVYHAAAFTLIVAGIGVSSRQR